jgi:uncharacterized protein (DUF1800 family)
MMAPSLTQQQKLVHFLNRTSFGPTSEELEKVQQSGITAYLDQQLSPEQIPDSLVTDKVAELKTMRLSSRELLELYPQAAVAQAKGMDMAQMQGPRQVILELQLARLIRAVYSRRQLYEVMVDFWSNHFNIYAGKGADRWLSTSYDRDTIRPHALGRFKDLLTATAQSPAMLFYLDNWMSVSPQSPAAQRGPNNPRRGINENYAREVMELHTLGVEGGYKQKDIQEVARCFTGWTIERPRGQGEFRFEQRFHDNGAKTVLGNHIGAGGGMEDGLKVIDILANHPATAKFIATKLARRFVADDPPAAVVSKASAVFHQSGGEIASVVRAIIDSPEFFSGEFYRGKVKKPLEYVASALRVTDAETKITHPLLRYLNRMGEPLFLAQPPTGHPDMGGSWISPDMLLTRINFVSDLVSNRLPGSRIRKDIVGELDSMIGLIAPDSISPATRAAMNEASGAESLALLLAAPEFQRR